MAEEIKNKLTKNKRLIWLILLLLLLLIIAAIIYLVLVYFQAPPSTVVNTNNNNLNQIAVLPNGQTIMPSEFNQPDSEVLLDLGGNVETEATQQNQANVLFVAQAFAERFGSYSNQSNYMNLDDLQSLMTTSMNNWVQQTYKDQLQKQNPNINTYYALETKAISSEVISLDETTGKAEIRIKTQRQEFKNDINNPRIFYQDIILNLVKQNDVWKVDGAFWQ